MKKAGVIFEEAMDKAKKSKAKDDNDILIRAIVMAIDTAQKEAWNEAIDAAAENAGVMRGSMGYGAGATVDKQSILKLKK